MQLDMMTSLSYLTRQANMTLHNSQNGTKAARQNRGLEEDLRAAAEGGFSQLLPVFRREACALHPDAGGTSKSFAELLATYEELCDEIAASQHCSVKTSRARPVVAATTSSSKCKKVPKAQCQEHRFWRRLHSLLRRLSSDARREAISSRLTQAQREGLERWMLGQQPAKQPKPKFVVRSPLTERSLGRQVHGSFRPGIHLEAGLYVQAQCSRELDQALTHLGILLAIRSLCRAAAVTQDVSHSQVVSAPVSQFSGFRSRVCAAVQEALAAVAEEERPRLYFRTRIAPAKRLELSTPTHMDLDAALADWRYLRAAAVQVVAPPQAAAQGQGARAAPLRHLVAAWETLRAKAKPPEATPSRKRLRTAQYETRMQKRAAQQPSQAQQPPPAETDNARLLRELDVLLLRESRRQVRLQGLKERVGSKGPGKRRLFPPAALKGGPSRAEF